MDISWNSEPINAEFYTHNVSHHQKMPSMEMYLKLLDHKSITGYQEKSFSSKFPLVSPYIAAYLLVVVSAAVLSNSVVLLVMGFRKKKLHSFQLCLVSVCISDLLFSLCLHPMSIATALGYNAKRIFNNSGCLYFGTMALFFGTYDMVAHSLIAILRYVNLCHPSRVRWVSNRSLLYLLLVCLVYSMAWSIGPAFGIGRYETFEVGCTMAFSDKTLSGRTFVNCAFVFVFFLPLAVTVYSYVAIVLEAGKQRQILDKLGRITTYGCNHLTVELKLVRLTSVIAAAYIIAWLPYAIVSLWDTYGNGESIPGICRILAALFCKTAAATNPLIYLFMSKSFRREVFETFKVLCKCKNRRMYSVFQRSTSQRSSSYRSSSNSSLRTTRVTLSIFRARNKIERSNTSSSSETINTYMETCV